MHAIKGEGSGRTAKINSRRYCRVAQNGSEPDGLIRQPQCGCDISDASGHIAEVGACHRVLVQAKSLIRFTRVYNRESSLETD